MLRVVMVYYQWSKTGRTYNPAALNVESFMFPPTWTECCCPPPQAGHLIQFIGLRLSNSNWQNFHSLKEIVNVFPCTVPNCEDIILSTYRNNINACTHTVTYDTYLSLTILVLCALRTARVTSRMTALKCQGILSAGDPIGAGARDWIGTWFWSCFLAKIQAELQQWGLSCRNHCHIGDICTLCDWGQIFLQTNLKSIQILYVPNESLKNGRSGKGLRSYYYNWSLFHNHCTSESNNNAIGIHG